MIHVEPTMKRWLNLATVGHMTEYITDKHYSYKWIARYNANGQYTW